MSRMGRGKALGGGNGWWPGPGYFFFNLKKDQKEEEEEEEEASMQVYREMVANLAEGSSDGSGGRPCCSRPLLN